MHTRQLQGLCKEPKLALAQAHYVVMHMQRCCVCKLWEVSIKVVWFHSMLSFTHISIACCLCPLLPQLLGG
jgi:hypothetical protein